MRWCRAWERGWTRWCRPRPSRSSFSRPRPEDTRNGNSHAKLIKDKDKDKANKIVSVCKRPIVKDREGMRMKNKRSKTEPRRVARDRNKVQ